MHRLVFQSCYDVCYEVSSCRVSLAQFGAAEFTAVANVPRSSAPLLSFAVCASTNLSLVYRSWNIGTGRPAAVNVRQSLGQRQGGGWTILKRPYHLKNHIDVSTTEKGRERMREKERMTHGKSASSNRSFARRAFRSLSSRGFQPNAENVLFILLKTRTCAHAKNATANSQSRGNAI